MLPVIGSKCNISNSQFEIYTYRNSSNPESAISYNLLYWIFPMQCRITSFCLALGWISRLLIILFRCRCRFRPTMFTNRPRLYQQQVPPFPRITSILLLLQVQYYIYIMTTILAEGTGAYYCKLRSRPCDPHLRWGSLSLSLTTCYEGMNKAKKHNASGI